VGFGDGQRANENDGKAKSDNKGHIRFPITAFFLF
jgi:hypothetical protein